jgi:broad-specificity NMP kinase
MPGLQDNDTQLTIYLISGPLGVGKSTTSKMLTRSIEQCVLIEGDLLLHMFKGATQPAWEERLSLTWENILDITRNFVRKDLHVVIDFVVEDELEWFYEQISDLNVKMKYVVLRADQETIIERLNRRGDIDCLERSLFLLNKLETSSKNQPYILDTTYKQTAEVVEQIVNDPRFQWAD